MEIMEAALIKAIRYCGRKQVDLAKLIGIDRKRLNYWLNAGRKIPLECAIK